MIKTLFATAALIVVTAMPAAAVSVNLDLGAGNKTGPLAVSDGTITTTFSNATTGQTGLKVATGLDLLTSDGICAGQGKILSLVAACGDILQVDFSAPVDNLAFKITGVELLTKENLTFTLADGTTVGGTDKDLIDLSLLGESILGTSIKTSLKGVSRFAFSTKALLGLNGGYVGDISFDLGGTGPSPVPLPAALPLMLAGLGAIGFAGKRKRRTA